MKSSPARRVRAALPRGGRRFPASAARIEKSVQAARSDPAWIEAQQIAALGSWEIDFGTGAVTVSAEMRRMFRWDTNVVPSTALILAAVHPEDRAAVAQWLAPPLRGKPQVEECVFRLGCANSCGLLIYGRCGVGWSRGGRRERLIGIVQDMTRLIEIERSAHQQVQFYRGIFENSVWGIFQTSADGQYLTANSALARIYGYDTPTELLSALTNIGGQLYVDPTRRDTFVSAMRERGAVTGFESQVYRRDGSVIWISESCREVHGEDGRFLYYEGMVEEITARKRVEEELRKAKETAEAANRAKSEFLGTMSHELRTPLNAIIGFSELMAAETLGPLGVPEYKTYIDDVLISGRHLLRIISDILDFAKTESGRIALRDEPLELPRLLEETAHLLRERAAFGGVALSLDIEPDLLYPPVAVRGDETRLKQVFLNLVGNAIKFTPRGGRVDIGVLSRAGEIRIEVRDNGIGMSPADLARAFEPFHQADGSLARSHEGTGLGLAICERLMRLHDGKVSLVSELGRGTVATVIIPAARRVFFRAEDARLRA